MSNLKQNTFQTQHIQDEIVRENIESTSESSGLDSKKPDIITKSIDLMTTQLNVYEASLNSEEFFDYGVVGEELTSSELYLINYLCKINQDQSDPNRKNKYIGNYKVGDNLELFDYGTNTGIFQKMDDTDKIIPRVYISLPDLIKRYVKDSKDSISKSRKDGRYSKTDINTVKTALEGLSTKKVKIYQHIYIDGVKTEAFHLGNLITVHYTQFDGIWIELHPVFRSGLGTNLNYVTIPADLKKIIQTAYGVNTLPKPQLINFVEFLYLQKSRNRNKEKYTLSLKRSTIIEKVAKKAVKKDRIEKALADVFRISAALPIIEKIDHRINDKNEDIYIFTFNIKDNN